MRILVTGASGLLGLNLALEASQEHEVFGSVNEHVIQTTKFTVFQSDLTRPGAFKELMVRCRPEWVINCAALANLDACEANPALARKLNSELPEKMAKVVAKGGARLVHISTDAVFDGKRGDYTEKDPPNPQSVYAETKLIGEQAVLSSDPQAIVARVNLFGWSLSGKRSLAEWFLNNLSSGKTMMGFTDVFFCPLLATDLARVLLEMLAVEARGLFHVVSSECTSKYDFGTRLAKLFNYDQTLIEPTLVSNAGLSAVRSTNLTLNSEKLSSTISRVLPDISDGLEQFYAQYQRGYPHYIRQMKTSYLGSGE